MASQSKLRRDRDFPRASSTLKFD